MKHPRNGARQYVTDDMSEGIDFALKAVDAVLIGRRTYEIFSKIWPSQDSEMPMADFLNHTHKYVVSSTLDKLEWGPASLIKGEDLRGEITKLKQGPGKNIQVPGSPTLIKSLMKEGLLDELTLSICPIGLGSGFRLFENSPEPITLTLVDSRTSPTGVLTVASGSGVRWCPEGCHTLEPTFFEEVMHNPVPKWTVAEPSRFI